jgi:hypothetical protein
VNKSPRLSLCFLWPLAGFSAAACLVFLQFLVVTAAIPQSARLSEELHGVLSGQPLKPPLRDAAVTLRYSSDGRTLMIQNASGVYLFSREPLVLRARIATEDIYPARFSSNSQEFILVSHALFLGREKLPAGPRLEQRALPFHEGCLDAELSPGAEFFACLTPDFSLVVDEISTNSVIFSASLSQSNSPYRVVYIPLDPDIAFPSPFGFRLANSWDSMAGKGMKFLSMDFSPDSKTLLVRSESEAFAVDLTKRRKTSLAGWLHKRLHASFCLENDASILIASGEKEESPVIVSLNTGAVTGNPAFKADGVRLAGNPRYALLSDTGTTGVRVFDLEENRELEVPSNLSIDIFGTEMAVLNDQGKLFLYKIGEKRSFLAADLPLVSLPVLRAAAVTPTLDRVAFSVDGNSASFQAATGERTYTGPRLSAANFSDQGSAYFLLPMDRIGPPRTIQLILGTGKSTPAWSGGKDFLRSGGTVLLEYSLPTMIGRRFGVGLDNDIPYRLRALDPANGKELWKREFFENSPVPFADPQGDRVVLGWYAKSPGAESAAKRIPQVWEIFKHAKISKLDSYFEILDALSGKSVGGVLIQVGSGPASYDAAFSAGDALFLIKDGKRVSVYSLRDGNLKSRFTGGIPTANSRSNLFVMEEGPGRLSIYDLTTAAKLDEQIFADAIAYAHFSADGNRLLVLTRHQVAYVLDVSGVHANSSAAPTPAPQ